MRHCPAWRVSGAEEYRRARPAGTAGEMADARQARRLRHAFAGPVITVAVQAVVSPGA